MIRALIIEDEKRSANILNKLIQEVAPEVTVLGIEHSIKKGLRAIEEQGPQLVFLDVQFPIGTGFDLLNQVAEIDFDVIFTTAYDHYAIQAIKFSALDYLLKPIDRVELRQAIARIRSTQTRSFYQKQKVDLLLAQLLRRSAPTTKAPKIALPTLRGYHFIEAEEVLYCEAEGTYCRIFRRQHSPILVSRNLKYLEGLLAEQAFFRVHRSYLVNTQHIVQYVRGPGGELHLDDGTVIPVSQGRKEVFLNYWLG